MNSINDTFVTCVMRFLGLKSQLNLSIRPAITYMYKRMPKGGNYKQAIYTAKSK